MEYNFDDILEIKNGRNQKAVENPNGKYPIYGSGGIMGYADDYICEPNTVIVGRKGSINNPIFVEEHFWNVDTAFGLQAKREKLNPRYLYYFCRKFDFEKLNKTVTIPSLTKTDLLKIKIDLPDLNNQQLIVNKLLSIERVISHRKEELEQFDILIKARFVELFGDPASNPYGFLRITVQEAIEGGYIEKPLDGNHGSKHPKASEYVEEGIPFVMANDIVDGSVDFENCAKLTRERADELDKGFAHDGDVLITHKGTIGRTAVLHTDLDYVMLTPQVTYYRPLQGILPEYLKGYFDSDYFQREMKLLAAAGGSTRAYVGITNQTQLSLLIPDLDKQSTYVEFIKQVDKSKIAVQKVLDETQTLFDSLMQEYFG